MKLFHTIRISLLSILFLFFLLFGLNAQTCPMGNVTFEKQSEINAFPMNFPSCDGILGNLIIKESSSGNIVDLTPLSQLKSVQGSMKILQNDQLVSLVGLQNISDIGLHVSVIGNQKLTNLEGLEGITIIKGDLDIIENNIVTTLKHLENINTIDGYLVIKENISLVSLVGFENLVSLGEYLTINGNTELLNISHLSNLSTIPGSLNVSNNNNLDKLDGLENISSIGGSLFISGNDILTDLSDLTNINSLPGFLDISNNNLLENLNGLESITSLGGKLKISNNPILIDLFPLTNINSISGFLKISNNNIITSLEGLENIDPNSIQSMVANHDDLEIFSNPNLPYCHISSICDALSLPTTTTNIHSNLTGCNTELEVQDLCCASVNPPTSAGNEEVCFGSPNPPLIVMVNSGETANWFNEATGGMPITTESITYTSTESAIGTYSYWAETKDIGNGCTSDPRTELLLTINNNPVFDKIETNCTNGTVDNVVVIATIPTGTLEYNLDGGTYQSSNTFPSVSVGTHNFGIRETGTLCSITESDDVDCNCPVVTNNSISSNQSICSGFTPSELIGTTPTTTPTTAFTYQWQSGPTGSNSWTNIGTSINFQPGPLSASKDYRRILVFTNCPNENSNILTITVNPLPSVSIDGPYGPICENAMAITLNGNPEDNGGIWTGAGVTDNLDGTASFSPAGLDGASPITVTYSYTDGNDCSDTSATETIIVNPTPVANAGTYGALCVDDTNITLIGTPTNTGGTWSGNGVTDNGDGTATFTSSTSNIGVNTLTYSYIDLNTNCPATPSTTDIIVNESPVLSNAIADCANDGTGYITITASIANGTLEYSTNGAIYQTSNIIIGLPNDTYTAYVREVNSECEVSLGNIIVNCMAICDNPPTSEAGIYDDVCAEAADIQLSGVITNAMLPTWSGGNGTFNPNNLVLNPLYSPTPTEIASGSVTLILSTEDPDGTDPCIAAVSTTTINIIASPTISTGGPYNALCSNDDSTILTGTPTDSGGEWSITPMVSGLMDNGNGTAIFDPSSLMGSYTLTYTYTDPNTQCTNAPASTPIEVFEIPNFTIQSTEGSEICFGSSTILSASVSNPNDYTYEWALPDASTSNNQTLEAIIDGLYTLTLIKNGCYTSQTYLLEIIVPDATLSITPDNLNVCQGEEVELTINGASSIVWDNPEAPDNTQTVIVLPTQSDNIFSAIVSSLGCQLELNVEFNVFSPQEVTIEVIPNEDYYCEGNEIILKTNDGYESWDWSNGNDTQNNPILTEDGIEIFNVTVTDSNGCNSMNSTPFLIDVRKSPTVQIQTQDDQSEVFTGADFNFTAINYMPDDQCTGEKNYTWNFLDTDGIAHITESSSLETITMNFTIPDIVVKQIELIVTDACDCISSSVIIPITITEDGSCSAPLTFEEIVCLGNNTILIADTQPGNDGGQPEKGFFTIDGIMIDLSSEGEEFSTANGMFKVIEVFPNYPITNMAGKIEIKFLKSGDYDFIYQFDYSNCGDISSNRTISVAEVPKIDEINFNDKTCFGQNSTIEFTILEEFEGKWFLNYYINGIEQTPKNLQFESLLNPIHLNNLEDDVEISFGNLFSENTKCSDNINEVYNIEVYEELLASATDTCSEDFQNIFYTINLEGGSGNFTVNNSTKLNDYTFVGDYLPSGEIITYDIEDLDCEDDYELSISLSSNCFSCFELQDYIIENPISITNSINICDNESFSTNFASSLELDALSMINQEVIYIIQKDNSDFYSADNTLLVFNPSSATDPFNFDINSAQIGQFEVDETYFLTIYTVEKSLNFSAPICQGMSPLPVKFHESPITNIEFLNDNTACLNEIDFQIGIQNVAHVNNWSLDNQDIANINYINGEDRALIDFALNIPSSVTSMEVLLQQENNYSSNSLSCRDENSIIIEILPKISPDKDSIIWWPGNFFTYTDSTKCYQWGVNKLEIEGETSRFYIHPNVDDLGEDIIWVDIYSCDDINKECITRVYYNVITPPGLIYNPNVSLNIDLYPNPNQGEFILELDGKQGGNFDVNILNSTGVNIYNRNFIKEYTNHKEFFYLTEFPIGIYFVQLIDQGGQRFVYKWIKQ